MASRAHGEDARALARGVARTALWCAGAAVAGLVLAPALLLGFGTGRVMGALALALGVSAGLLALGISGVLRLNAALFQLMASHGDEISGGMRADEFLSRAGLQAEPAVIRRLSERAGVVHRLRRVQALALGVFALMSGLSALALVYAP